MQKRRKDKKINDLLTFFGQSVIIYTTKVYGRLSQKSVTERTYPYG